MYTLITRIKRLPSMNLQQKLSLWYVLSFNAASIVQVLVCLYPMLHAALRIAPTYHVADAFYLFSTAWEVHRCSQLQHGDPSEVR